MIKLVLKHYLYDYCISLIFSKIKNNFYKNKKFEYVEGKQYKYITLFKPTFWWLKKEIDHYPTYVTFYYCYIYKEGSKYVIRSKTKSPIALRDAKGEILKLLIHSSFSLDIDLYDIIDWKEIKIKY